MIPSISGYSNKSNKSNNSQSVSNGLNTSAQQASLSDAKTNSNYSANTLGSSETLGSNYKIRNNYIQSKYKLKNSKLNNTTNTIPNTTQVLSCVGNREMQVTITKDNKSRERIKEKDRILKSEWQEVKGVQDEVDTKEKHDRKRDKSDPGKNSPNF